jgi:YhcH/YjgK/YiaL family protein
MIVGTLAGADRYRAVHAGFAAAIDFLRRDDLDRLLPGRYEIDGSRVFALVEHATGRGVAGAKLEVHRRHLDIQVSLDGREQIGWRALDDCREPEGPFSAEKDIGFFLDRPIAWLPLARGQFMLLFPDDAHAPLAGEGPLHKVVVKLLME